MKGILYELKSNLMLVFLTRRWIPVLAFLYLSTTTLFARNWERIAVSTGDSISFPEKPTIDTIANKAVYGLVTDSYMMSFMVHDFRDIPGFEVQTDQLEGFYEEMLTGLYPLDKPLIDHAIIEASGVKGIQIVYTDSVNSLAHVRVTKRIILKEKKLFILEFWSLTEANQAKLMDIYFTSLVVKTD